MGHLLLTDRKAIRSCLPGKLDLLEKARLVLVARGVLIPPTPDPGKPASHVDERFHEAGVVLARAVLSEEDNRVTKHPAFIKRALVDLGYQGHIPQLHRVLWRHGLHQYTLKTTSDIRVILVFDPGTRIEINPIGNHTVIVRNKFAGQVDLVNRINRSR